MKQGVETKFFTVLDISNGFWSIPLNRSCQYKFAFTFQGQQYTWTCLPQGFHNSPSIFHRQLATGLEKFPRPECLVQYVDDLLLQTTSREEHVALLDELLTLLHSIGCKVNPKKAQIMKPKVLYLGTVITHGKREIERKRIESIVHLPRPRNVSALRSFLGLVGYCRNHIDGFATKAAPLSDLLKKNATWQWTAQHTAAVTDLKHTLATAPARLVPDPDLPYAREVAATDHTLSAVLLQERHGRLGPVAYASRVLDPVEQDFSGCERHLLAVFWAVQYFAYITGLNPITVLTEHTPTQRLLDSRLKDGSVSQVRAARWTLLLQGRDITVKRTKVPTF